jgi:hypothetical protein
MYHGVMTIVDILFLPPLLICCIFCWRSRSVLLALRQGFNNKARRAILFAVWLVFTDILLLPPLLIVLCPYGWIFQRAKPLYRQLCRRAASMDPQLGSVAIARSPSDRSDITQVVSVHTNGSVSGGSGGSGGRGGRGGSFNVEQVAVALKARMESHEWHGLILRQFFLLLLDTLVFPCTFVVYTTRWRWHSMTLFESFGKLTPITAEGVELNRLIGIGLITSQIYESKIDRDSSLLYHCWVITSFFVVLHDIVLVVGIGSIVCCSFYRIRRYVAIMEYARSLWNKSKSNNQDTELEREIWYHHGYLWRMCLWKQFFMFLFVDTTGWCIGLLTCVVSPHRLPWIWSILKNAYTRRTTPWCASPPVDNSTATTNGLEMKVMDTTINAHQQNEDDDDVDEPKHWPDWNGVHPNDLYYDGYWWKLIIQQFCSGLIDLPFIIASLPVICTIYRIDKLLMPMYYNKDKTIWKKRILPFRQCLMVILDILCLPLFFFVIGTLYRSYPSCKKWCSKRTKPCLDNNPLTKVEQMAIHVTGKQGVSKCFVNVFMRVKGQIAGVNDDVSLLQKEMVQMNSPQLRIMGKKTLWNATTTALGEMTSSLAQSMLPVDLTEENLHCIQVNETANPNANNVYYDLHLRMELPMKRSTIYKKSNLIFSQFDSQKDPNDNTFSLNLQIETLHSTSKKRQCLFSINIPFESFVDAAKNGAEIEPKKNLSTEESNIEVSNTMPLWMTAEERINKHLGKEFDYTGMQTPSQLEIERGEKFDYTDMRDSFAAIFFTYFLMILRDIFHLMIALIILPLAPWRFVTLVFTLCEPKRRYPIRISSKLMSKLYNSCDIDEELAYELLTLHANEYSKINAKCRQGKLVGSYTQDFSSTCNNLTARQLKRLQNVKKAERILKHHEECMNAVIKHLRTLRPNPPSYMPEVIAYLKLRDQRLHHVAIHMHLNRARLYQLFPSNGLNGDEITTKFQEHEALPVLLELQKSEQNEHEYQSVEARKDLMEKQSQYETEGLKSQRCKKWGCWHKSEGLCRTLSRYMLVAGLQDWLYILCNILLLVTLYKIPAICRDFSNVPRMTTCQAWSKFFNPSGSARIRRIVRKHIREIVVDLTLLIYNIFLFACVLLLIVRFPKYISYLPLAKSMRDLSSYGKKMIFEVRIFYCCCFIYLCRELMMIISYFQI